MSQTDEGKLKTLLDYWINHNREHAEEFREWAEKAGGIGKEAVQRKLVQASKEMEKANASLAAARKVMGSRAD